MDELERADHAYQLERAGILSSAVGMARLALRDGDAEKARALLDEASIKCSTLLGDALLAGCEQPTGSGRPSLFPSHRRRHG